MPVSTLLGILPEITSRSPSPTVRSSRSTRSSSCRRPMAGPGSLMSVFSPCSGSTIFKLVRVSPSTPTVRGVIPMAFRASMACLPVLPPQSATLRLAQPSFFRHLETFTPLPPTSVRRVWIRFTAPARKPGITTVLSMAGFSVSVTIIGFPPVLIPPSGGTDTDTCVKSVILHRPFEASKSCAKRS